MRENVVMAVAVVARRDFRRNIGTVQRHGLAMVGASVEPVVIGMAGAAALVHHLLERGDFRVDDLVSRVTAGADGHPRIAFGEQLPVNALFICPLNAHMAFAAGFSYVGVVDRGTGVHVAFDVMHAMTVITRWSHDEAHFDQRLTMHAVDVFSGGGGVPDFVLVSQSRVAVTFGARARQIHFINRRGAITNSNNVVRAVAIPARSSARRTEEVAHPVDAGRVGFGLPLVTAGAIGRRQRTRMRELFDARMAVSARKAGVN